MRVIAGFFRFWYGFIVGDDWRVAAAVVVSLELTALLAQIGLPAWWLLPSAVVLFLSLGVLAAARP
ncbi:MAG: hypothetical protein K6T57_12670 [Thermaceae bacterium]|nr:hypothetical protein [Thermaceae bacterium]